MKKNQKKNGMGIQGITIPTINLAGFSGILPQKKSGTATNGIVAMMNQMGGPRVKPTCGFTVPTIQQGAQKSTKLVRGPTRRRTEGEYTLSPEDIGRSENLTGEQMATLDVNDPREAAMLNAALHKRERQIIEDRKNKLSPDELHAYEEEEKQEAKNRGKKRRSNLTHYAKGIQKAHSFRGTIREFIVPESEIRDTPGYLRNKKIINIYCNDKGIMSYENVGDTTINDVTKGPIVTPSRDDVDNQYVFPHHASWYRDRKLKDGFDDVAVPDKEPKGGFPVGDEVMSRYSPKQREVIKRLTREREEYDRQQAATTQAKRDGGGRKRGGTAKPVQKRGTAKMPLTVAKKTARRSR